MKYKDRINVGIFLFLLISTIFFCYTLYNFKPITLRKQIFQFEYGEELSTDPAYYLSSHENTTKHAVLNLDNVLGTVGQYRASVDYYDVTLYFEIKIVDTTKPKFILYNNQVTIEKKNTLFVKDLIASIDDMSVTQSYFYDEDTGAKVESMVFEDVGSYIEKVIVVDEHGNESSIQRVKVNVIENTTPPKILGVEDITISLNQPIDLLEGVSAIDDLDGNITHKMTVTGHVNNGAIGEYQVIYSVSDSSGNKTEVVRKVTVE